MIFACVFPFQVSSTRPVARLAQAKVRRNTLQRSHRWSNSFDGASDCGESCIAIAASSSRVVPLGRTVKDKPKGTLRFDWSHTGLAFNTTGKPSEVWVRLKSGGQHLNVYVDGEHADVIGGEYQIKERSYKLASSLDEDVEITISKRNEPAPNMFLWANDEVTVSNIFLKPNAEPDSTEDPDLAEPDARFVSSDPRVRQRVIEFVGASDVTAFGIMAKRSSVYNVLQIDSSKQDADKGWPSEVAKAFNAFPNIIGWSGSGLSRNINPGGYLAGFFGPPEGPLPSVYSQLLGKHNWTGQHPGSRGLGNVDLVVIFAGCNDVEAGASEDDISDGLAGFVNLIRTHHKGAPILALYPDKGMSTGTKSASEQDMVSEKLERAFSRGAEMSGGKSNLVIVGKVTANPKLSFEDDGDWSTMNHYSVTGHTKFAKGVIPLVQNMIDQGVLDWNSEKRQLETLAVLPKPTAKVETAAVPDKSDAKVEPESEDKGESDQDSVD